MSDWIDEVIRLLLNSSFLSLATTDRDGRPWVTPVEFACDDALRFYWTSHHDARHSRNVRANPRAAMTIFDSTQVPGVRAEVQGLYAEGPVEVLEDADLDSVRPSLRRWLALRDAARGFPAATTSDPSGDDDTSGDDTSGDDETAWRQYRLTPVQLYALDPAGHPDEPGVRIWRVPVDLTDAVRRSLVDAERRGGGHSAPG